MINYNIRNIIFNKLFEIYRNHWKLLHQPKFFICMEELSCHIYISEIKDFNGRFCNGYFKFFIIKKIITELFGNYYIYFLMNSFYNFYLTNDYDLPNYLTQFYKYR